MSARAEGAMPGSRDSVTTVLVIALAVSSGIVRESHADDQPARDKEAIGYESDGLKVTGLLSKPRGPGPFPLVVVNHGGYEPARSVAGFLDLFVTLGYVALAPDYRGC